ncbi:ABC transporter ATP-binding protein [Peptostreptococcus sp.]|jgi:ABC-type multidrug transport system, ATPase component
MNNVIEIKNLKKVYNNITTVDLKSLTVRKGEIYGFLGPNGAGKSTTMKMILSLLEPTSGEIDIFGNPVEKNTEYLNHIGSMIEEPSYYPNLSGYENLLVFQKMIGFDKKNIWPTLELVGLAEKKNRRKLVKAYSLGMKQRLALAFALVKDPKILLLDEPTNGLDPAGIHEIRELIIRLAKEKGLTVFISSHILSEIEHIADRVGIINRGRLVYEGKIEKIKSNAWLEIEGDFFSDTKLKEVLEGTGVTDISDKILKFKNMDNEETSKIIRQLVIAGYPIYRVERKKESLEDIFLSMTKED